MTALELQLAARAAALAEENRRLRATLRGVRDWFKSIANSEGGLCARIDALLCECEAADAERAHAQLYPPGPAVPGDR